MFYLVMPTEQGESITDDPSDPPTPTATHFPQPQDEATLPQMRPEAETPACVLEANQLESMQLELEEEEVQSQDVHKTHIIKNVDEIFHTIEGLMGKLRRLKVSSS